MPKLIHRLFLMSVVCAGAAFGQNVAGTFAQIAFGGSWQTTFTLVNVDSTNVAGVTLNFFGDNGGALNAPVTVPGLPNTSSTNSYTFTIPPNSSQSIVLANTDPNVTQGWASMTVASGRVQGQGSFRAVLPSGSTFEAVVPLATSGSTVCIIPFPPTGTPIILLPFDNTGGYNSSIAIANTGNLQVTIPIEYDDQTNHQLKLENVVLGPMAHTAFTLASKYPLELGNKKGIIRIQGSPSGLSVLGLLSNPSNAITTIIPIVP